MKLFVQANSRCQQSTLSPALFQRELCRGMEPNCYCCRPGPVLPPSCVMEPNANLPAAPQPLLLLSTKARQDTAPSLMDVDSALSELDSLRTATGTASSARPKSSGSLGPGAQQDRTARVRSLSESMTGSAPGLTHSHSESSLLKPQETGVRGSHNYLHHHYQRKLCSMGTKMIGCSLSLPRKIGGYHVVQRNAAFVSDISGSRSRNPLQHSSSLPTRWLAADGSVGCYSNQSSCESSPPSMGVYRDSDLLEERSSQRRLARVRFDRARRLRQPYSVPFRMYQSMHEDSTASLNDFLRDTDSERVSKSTTVSPVKQDLDASLGMPSGGSLVRSRSIDNLELAKLRLTDVLETKTPSPSEAQLQAVELEQVATDLKNLQMV